MEQWYKENIEALRHKIIDEFSYLYNKYRKKIKVFMQWF
ncbi:Uncharacterised protein [Chryseobacterium jejuense]|uniref:Uncharacterized protein n=1 Tax=Chryseobacterium jejuense TaxID=445960 RepID=A0A2X2XMN3_CHRJE|nr:Uncharacterised protein [Chryseobacterium jejuense]